jgi:hypothetical protein
MMEERVDFGARSLSGQQLPGILLKIKQKDKKSGRLHRLEFMTRPWPTLATGADEDRKFPGVFNGSIEIYRSF